MLKPLHQNVVVKVKEVPQTTASGIILSGSESVKTHTEGIVEAVGNGRVLNDGSLASLTVEVGHTIIFNEYDAKTIMHEGKEYMIVSEDKILAIVE